MTRGHGLPQMLSKGSRELLQGARSEPEDALHGLPRRNRSSSRWEPLSQSHRWDRLSLVARWLWELHSKAEKMFSPLLCNLAPHSQQFCFHISFFSDATCPCLPLTAAIRGPRHRHTETRAGTYMHHDKRFVVFPHGTSSASSFRGSSSLETNLITL